MKTISIYLNQNNNGINQSITTKTLHRNFKYYQNYDLAAGDINRNATISQIEHERNICEEELYRLRYGIENLLANKEQRDFKIRQQKNLTNIKYPFRTTTTNINNLNNKITSWIDRCTPCCRRWRRNRRHNNIINPNGYSRRQIYNDQNYDNASHRTSKSSQLYSDSFISTSPSISSRYTDPNRRQKKRSLKRSIRKLINRMTPNKMNVSNLLKSNNINDPLYNSLILKILEAKALDCLCTGYSKENTRKQISKALNEMNQRIGEQQLNSISAISSPSSSKSSILTYDKFPSSPFNTTQPSNEEISSLSSSTDTNKQKIKSSLKLNENIKLPKKKSKVTIVSDKTSQSKNSKTKKRPSSKHRKKNKQSSKQKHKPTNTAKKRSKSQTSNKKRNKSRTSDRKRNSSKLKKKGSSKSSSRSGSNKKRQTKTKRHSKQKQTKPKSNNQMNDHETIMLPIFMHPQSYQENNFSIMRLLSIFSLFIFCLSLLMINGEVDYNVDSGLNGCEDACRAACLAHCPKGGCEHPGPTYSWSSGICYGCNCPVFHPDDEHW
ncbi:unnamed protein product [Rotaria sordida]|uniref:Uncharacterized protein n=1 Tax=Rotaria sordida TaxID=392033 RepID=A0A813RCQ4_9BILA|nr:unnamed protein product [Rotaria sordida]